MRFNLIGEVFLTLHCFETRSSFFLNTQYIVRLSKKSYTLFRWASTRRLKANTSYLSEKQLAGRLFHWFAVRTKKLDDRETVQLWGTWSQKECRELTRRVEREVTNVGNINVCKHQSTYTAVEQTQHHNAETEVEECCTKLSQQASSFDAEPYPRKRGKTLALLTASDWSDRGFVEMKIRFWS